MDNVASSKKWNLMILTKKKSPTTKKPMKAIYSDMQNFVKQITTNKKSPKTKTSIKDSYIAMHKFVKMIPSNQKSSTTKKPMKTMYIATTPITSKHMSELHQIYNILHQMKKISSTIKKNKRFYHIADQKQLLALWS